MLSAVCEKESVDATEVQILGQLGALIKNYERVLVPELNTGQLSLLIRGNFLVDAVSLNKIEGKPFLVHELVAKIEELCA